MRREQLEQYRDLTKAIRHERQRLEKERKRTNVEVDTVTGSSPHFPYEKRVISVEGVVKSPRQRRLESSLARMLQKEEAQMEQILLWIEEIPSCRTRRMFHWYYIEGYTYEKIARLLHYTEGRVRQIMKAYLGE